MCTGMTPQSDLLSNLSPESINPKNRLVKTKPSLQIVDDAFPNIFAAGDVADLEDVKVRTCQNAFLSWIYRKEKRQRHFVDH